MGKTVFRQVEDDGKIDIIECIEDQETKTRNIVKWICQVTPQQTHKETKFLAYEITGKLNKE